MGGCMSWPRMMHRSHGPNFPLEMDLRRIATDQRDERHLARFASAANITVEQARTVLDLFFDVDCEGQTYG